ncbi:flavin reductase family protein [Primorskyibacter sp. S87]|uniref:flavin reductase family protein n=1 Tax=Primorskyibacter sp. S87 TaxID=3415126 RepID=UPI003C7986BF
MTAFDPKEIRKAFGRFMTGVTVVTTRANDGTPVGFTANSFTSVSLDPPLLLVCPGKFLSSFDAFENATHFAVSVLAEGQEEVSNTFAGFKGDRFARIPHEQDLNGVPVINGAVAWFSCQTHRVMPAGDHTVLVGQVTGFDHHSGGGLGYADGRYFSLGLERAAGESPPSGAVVGAIVETPAGVLLEETPHGLRPPQVMANSRTNQLESLSDGLAVRGMKVDLGRVYSAYDDRRLGTHHTYVLATAPVPTDMRGLRCVASDDLSRLGFATPAIATMMSRFATETRTRSFTLYLGDEDAGDTHKT